MKKTLIATAIMSSLVSATTSAATLYNQDGTSLSVGGRAEVRGLFSDEFEGSMKDKSRARINFSGVTQLSENLTGFGFMEYEIKPDSDLENRYLFAGFGTKIGDFSYGKQDTANVQVSDMTDIASTHSGQQQYIGSASDKQSNTFLYSGTFADALTVQVDYVALELENQDAVGISAFYTFDFGLDIAASYSDQDKANQATFGAGYTWNKLYVATTYAMGAIDDQTDFSSLEAAIEYKITKQLRLIGIIGMADEDTGNSSIDTEDFYALEGQYRFNKSIRTYLSYKLNNLSNQENELLAGLRYSF